MNHSLVLSSAASHRLRTTVAFSQALRSAARGSPSTLAHLVLPFFAASMAICAALRRFGSILHPNSAFLHGLAQFRLGFFLNLARGVDHFTAHHAACRLRQLTARCCSFLVI